MDPAARSSPVPAPDSAETRTRELLERWRAGDLGARDRLIERHRGPLVEHARTHPLRRRLESRPEATELAHEALARALPDLPRNFEDRGRGSLGGFLWRVLERTLLDRRRRESAAKRQANVARLERDGEGSAPQFSMSDARSPSPTSAARAAEWLERVRAVLDAREWELWHAVEVEGRSTAEVARARGQSESAARGVLFRARARLLERLIEPED